MGAGDPTRSLGPASRAASADAARELAAGEQVGPWIVAGVLARGGFGTVYEARHARTPQRGALKLLHAHLATSPEMLARFDREVQVIGRLRHPNIVELVDGGFSRDGRPYLCMELLDGDDLGARMARTGALAPAAALAVFEPICDALAHAHAHGIVHRDVKASNVLVCRPPPGAELGRVVLLDFGIAKLSDALAPELTATHQSLGTPSCMAPEQIHGTPVDARTDVYALGGLLFHLITGHLPFDDPSVTMTQYLHLHARRPRPSAVAAVPERLDHVIASAMAIEPSERFADAPSLLAAARAALRASAAVADVRATDAAAILVTTADRDPGGPLDEALLDDLEGVLPAAERFLAGCGFTLAVDLGSTALFVAPLDAGGDPVAVARATWVALTTPPRHARVQIGVAAHRGSATYAGAQLQPGALVRPATWRLPDALEGVWVTAAIEPGAPNGRRVG